MSVEYSAIAAKLKAMYSKFLTRDDYEQLLERKSVNDICSYLKSTPGYGAPRCWSGSAQIGRASCRERV